jgi:hypothetical protein
LLNADSHQPLTSGTTSTTAIPRDNPRQTCRSACVRVGTIPSHEVTGAADGDSDCRIGRY